MRVKESQSRVYQPAPIKVKQTTSEIKDVIFQLHQRSSELYQADRFSSASICESAANSLTRYCATIRKKYLSFEDVTPKFLSGYESWMLKHGKLNKSHSLSVKGSPASSTTIKMYIQFIKYVFGQAIERDMIKASTYPFKGKNAYVVPSSAAGREARSREEIQLIIDLEMENEFDNFYKDMWVFSFLVNGINMKDVTLLRWTDVDIRKRTISFFREKSRTTQRSSRKQINGSLLDKTIEIINKWGAEGSVYLFPVIWEGYTPIQIERAKKNFILKINRTMKKVGEQLGLEGDLRTYVARHSFANILMQQEVPVAFLSEALGHSKLTTTQAYVGKFSSEKTHDYVSRLLS